jgi:hypothetical protein
MHSLVFTGRILTMNYSNFLPAGAKIESTGI